MAEARESIFLGDEKEVTPEAVRKFVRELAELTEKVKDARDALKEAIKENDDIERIDSDIKALREERKQVLATNGVLVSYADELADATEERKQLIDDAKQDGIPRNEIDFAIKMLKKNVDPSVTTEIFKNIADLVD
jgi:SMC interacting uncharacterized protein involved in chromosome segregation